MRFPDSHKLLGYFINELFQLDTKEFIMSDPNTYYYINGIRRTLKDYLQDPDSLGFDTLPEEKGKTAEELFGIAVAPYLQEVRAKGWHHFMETYDHLSLSGFFQNTNLSASAVSTIIKLLNMESCLAFSFGDNLIGYYDINGDVKLLYVPNGNDALPRAFLKALQESKIFFNAQVTHVTQDSSQVMAEYVQHFPSGSQKSNITADYLLMTPSAPVVSFMEFQPPLSSRKRNALRTIYHDTASKIALAFSTRFWEAEGIRGGKSITDLPSRIFYYLPEQLGFAGGVVVSYTWTYDSYLFHGLSEKDCLRIALNNLAAIHGQHIRKFYIGGKVKHWLLDPFALGAYSFLFPNQISETFKGVWDNEGRVWFAGEYTSHPRTWAETAVKSGLRAAISINRKSFENGSSDDQIHVSSFRNEL